MREDYVLLGIKDEIRTVLLIYFRTARECTRNVSKHIRYFFQYIPFSGSMRVVCFLGGFAAGIHVKPNVQSTF